MPICRPVSFTSTALALSLAGLCSAATARPEAPASQPADGPDAVLLSRIEALLQKSKRDLVFIKGGSFRMGDFGAKGSPEQPESKPAHEVKLDGFSLGRYKVTHEDFDIFSDASGSPRIAAAKFDQRYRATPNVPAGVNWPEAKAYCQWLGRLTQLPFDLPSEAQWEYAARNGGRNVLWATNNGRYEEGKNVASPEQYQSLMPNYLWDTPLVHPVGKFPPSPLGLYDMGSNGFDWVDDWFDAGYYAHALPKNPRGPATGREKVQRGYDPASPESAITTYRQKRNPLAKPQVAHNGTTLFERSVTSGFRCAVNDTAPVDP